MRGNSSAHRAHGNSTTRSTESSTGRAGDRHRPGWRRGYHGTRQSVQRGITRGESTLEAMFVGGAGTVTGSCTLLLDEATGIYLLVDLGAYQGVETRSEEPEVKLPIPAANIPWLVLTHAHLDHCGGIPGLYQAGFQGEVICTEATKELAELVLLDAAKQSRKSDMARRTVERIRWRALEPQNGRLFGVVHKIAPGLSLKIFPSGHLVGSVSVKVTIGTGSRRKSILFSGDVGGAAAGAIASPLHGAAASASKSLRKSKSRLDAVVCESTYGYGGTKRRRSSHWSRLRELKEEVEQALFVRRGVLLIPCFALGRTQEVLFDLHCLFAREPDRYKGIPVIFDACLASKANKVYGRHLFATEGGSADAMYRWLPNELFDTLELDGSSENDRFLARAAVTQALTGKYWHGRDWRDTEAFEACDSQLIANWRPIVRRGRFTTQQRHGIRGPAIVVTGGGMCDGGPIIDYLVRYLMDPSATIMLTGYQAKGTLGRLLYELSLKKRGPNRRMICLGEEAMPADEAVATIRMATRYSAHATREDLVEFISAVSGNGSRNRSPSIFLNHGTDSARASLRRACEKKMPSGLRFVLPHQFGAHQVDSRSRRHDRGGQSKATGLF